MENAAPNLSTAQEPATTGTHHARRQRPERALLQQSGVVPVHFAISLHTADYLRQGGRGGGRTRQVSAALSSSLSSTTSTTNRHWQAGGSVPLSLHRTPR